jgi:2,4-dienoyl-CoA reductase-like NADH-dependent reductase (Old Yellow Enzyme family)
MNRVFEKTSFAGIGMRNRIIRSATHEGMGDRDGRPLRALTDLYEQLAANQVGAIITGFAGVNRNGRILPNMVMFDRDEYVDDYRALNAKIGEYNVPVILQLVHGGGQCFQQMIGDIPVAPSSIKVQGYESKPQELSGAGIETIIDSFVRAIGRAQKAGFAGAEIHAAHGYLLAEFLSPHYNHRQDRWGGSVENRFRIVGEILRRARQTVDKYPIMVKISAHDLFEDGAGMEDVILLAQMLQQAECDAIEVSCGNYDGFLLTTIRMPAVPVEAMLKWAPQYAGLPEQQKEQLRVILPQVLKVPQPLNNYNVEAAARIKSHVDIPVIVVGGIRKLSDIEDIVKKNKSDFVSMSRPFVIEPDIVAKFGNGRQAESHCINCGFCLLGVVGHTLKCYHGKIPTD